MDSPTSSHSSLFSLPNELMDSYTDIEISISNETSNEGIVQEQELCCHASRTPVSPIVVGKGQYENQIGISFSNCCVDKNIFSSINQ